ncbi:redoxin domain-containing protein [Deinococcus roseus]|uniref:Alkyl hydroperoxide reductase n=1 Tax=Deinococcus roseus TaxID=392414 RepID=A0ABQ2D3X1_9DEIO|nr:redoxin domain-containing protein [Deinococcus roseus]GGJ45283.1 alkyl hydroperoxide reductase [Deinococcus roseus]
MLQAGELSPLFQTQDFRGQPIQPSDFRGKYTLLSFFRNGACAMCNLRVHQLIQQQPQLQAAGIQTITVFESGLESIEEHVGKQNPPFPILPDPQAKLYDLYGLESSESKIQSTMQRPDLQDHIQEASAAGFALQHEEGSNFHRMPADFLIGPDLRIVVAHYADYVYDHLPFEEVFRLVGDHQKQPVSG